MSLKIISHIQLKFSIHIQHRPRITHASIQHHGSGVGPKKLQDRLRLLCYSYVHTHCILHTSATKKPHLPARAQASGSTRTLGPRDPERAIYATSQWSAQLLRRVARLWIWSGQIGGR